jgi:tRNA A-37 threonylcarbamoyl transferase component Bud32
MRGYKKIFSGNMRGRLREEIVRFLPSGFFSDPVSSIQTMKHEVVKESRLRWAALFTLPNGEKIFLKRDRTKDWTECLKFLVLPSRGRKEWWISYQSQKRNLHIPMPLGWMEKVRRGTVKESFYLSEAVGSGDSLIDLARSTGFSFEGLVKAVKKIHDAGLLHKDFHGGNFLWDGESFYLTDLHRASILRSLSLNQRLWSLSHLFHSLRSLWGEETRGAFLMRYFEGEPHHLQRRKVYLKKIDCWMDRLQKRRWKSRTKRCLKESTEFSVQKEGGDTYYHRRDFPLNRIKRAMGEHLRRVKERTAALAKNGPEVAVSLFDDKGTRLCVKQFKYPGLWHGLKEHLRRSKGLKSWIGANALLVREIPSVTPLALVERWTWIGLRESFFLMEAGRDREMDRYLSTELRDFAVKRRFIRSFGRWLAEFHKLDMFHKDMKTCNILVSENEDVWNFTLLDLEDLLVDRKVGESELFRNLLQLNASIPKMLTRADRLRFLHQYLSLRPVSLDKKRFVRKIIRETLKRGTVYVAPWGVVKESS